MSVRWPATFGVFAACVAALSIQPGAVRAESLQDALAAAYANNPTLLAQRARLRATDERVPQAQSNWRPTVTLSGDYGVSKVENDQLTPPDDEQDRTPHSLALSVNQPLYRGGRTVAAVSRAENQVQSERARLLATEQSVLLQAATAYMNVLRDQAVLQLNINNEQVLVRQLEATRDRFEVGEITRTDVHQAEARLARATADRIQAEGNLEASKAEYANVVGAPPGNLERPFAIEGLPSDLQTATQAAVTGNPSVVGAMFDENAAMDTIDEVRGELLPSLNLNGSATRAYETVGEDSEVDTLQAKVTLTVPLYQAGAVYSRLREARQNAAGVRRTVDQERRDARESATRSWEALHAARARTKSFNAQIEAARVALDGVQREAAVGSRTVLDVLDAEQEYLDAQVNLVRAERDEMVAVFELKTAVGQLTAAQMNLPVDVYDFDRHFQEVRNNWFGGNSSGDVDSEAAGQ